MRLSEIYPSTQGEGPKVGLPTLFVRFAGCNLKCPGWPCDTEHAINPAKYRSEWQTFSPDELGDEIIWRSRPGQNICFTGGEPFLQPNEELRILSNDLYVSERKLECFSNGTLSIPEWAFKDMDFILDWKLTGSGEKNLNADMFLTNLHRALGSSQGSKRHVVKFTVANWHDFDEAVTRYDTLLRDAGVQVYVGPVWDKVEPREIVQWVLDCDLNWKLNIQTHKYIFDPGARRT